jgi:hypothetical protein
MENVQCIMDGNEVGADFRDAPLKEKIGGAFAFELSSLNLPHPTLALTPSERASSYYMHPCVFNLTQVFLLQLPMFSCDSTSDICAYNYSSSLVGQY